MDSDESTRPSAGAWDDVAQQFRSLGQQLAERYREQAPASESVDRDAVDRAVRRIADAVEQAVDSVGSAVRDPSFRDQARRAAQSLVDAIGTTVTEFGEDLKTYAPRYTAPPPRTERPADEDVWEEGPHS